MKFKQLLGFCLIFALLLTSAVLLTGCFGGGEDVPPPPPEEDTPSGGNGGSGGGAKPDGGGTKPDGGDGGGEVTPPPPPKGLVFDLSKDETYYTLKSVGGLKDKNIVIPAEHEGKPVTVIGKNAFKGHEIDSITLSPAITKIEAGAFLNCGLKDFIFSGTAEEWAAVNMTYGALDGNNFTCILAEDAYIFTDGTVKTFSPEIVYLELPGGNAYTAFRCFDDVEELVIAPYVEGKPVISISENAFKDAYSLSSVYMGYHVTEIGDGAFNNCKKLSNVVWGKDLTHIGTVAFSGCKALTTLDLPAGLRVVGKGAFADTTIEHITLPEGLLALCNDAFHNALFTELTVPDSLCYIGEGVFPDSYVSAQLETMEKNQVFYVGNIAYFFYTDRNGGPFDVTLKEGTVCVAERAFFMRGNVRSVTFPKSLKYIAPSAFNFCDALTEVNFGGGLQRIHCNAFNETPWWEAQPQGVVYTDNIAYNYKGTMADGECIILDEGTVGVSAGFLSYSKAGEVILPDSLTYVGESAFSECKQLTSIQLGSGLETVERLAFTGNPLLSSLSMNGENSRFTVVDGCLIDIANKTLLVGTGNATIPSDGSVAKIGEKAFYASAITDVVIPDSVTSIGKNAFDKCESLASLDLGGGVILIEDNAFHLCKALTSLVIPDQVRYIMDGAFDNCVKITKLTLGNGISYLGRNTFYHLNNLTRVDISDLLAFMNINFLHTSMRDRYNPGSFLYNNPLFYAKNLYINGQLLTDLVIPDEITKVPADIFHNASCITSVTFHNGITEIGDRAFTDIKLDSIFLPDSVTYVGAAAFSNSNATTISFSSSLKTIGRGAFHYAYITELNLPDTLEYIGDRAFSYCRNLVSPVVIPDSVTYVGEEAFYFCEKITNITLGSGVKTVGDSAFTSCYKLSTFRYNGSTGDFAAIGNYKTGYWFGNCSNLRYITCSNGSISIAS